MREWSLERLLVVAGIAMAPRHEAAREKALPAGTKALTTPEMIEAVGGKVWH